MWFGGGWASRGILKLPTKADEACLHSAKKFQKTDETSKRSMCGFFLCVIELTKEMKVTNMSNCQLPPFISA